MAIIVAKHSTVLAGWPKKLMSPPLPQIQRIRCARIAWAPKNHYGEFGQTDTEHLDYDDIKDKEPPS